MKENKVKDLSNKGYMYILVCTIIIVILGIIGKSTAVILLSSIFGMLSSVLFAQNIRNAFLFNIIYIILYTYILIGNQMYGLTINLLFFTLPMTIWGYIKWGRIQNSKNSGIKQISKKSKIKLFFCVAIVISIQSYILKIYGGHNVILDSMVSILGYVGWYLTSNKYIEQWTVWIVVNFVNILLWSVLAFQDIQNLSVLIMWVMYEVNSIYGYINFKRISKIESET